ncbi:hypothetical protein [Methanobacterium sp.]|uniref:hypothetical protein n=1 Tax=Methanobacterium sp. TaxID=2164 RepID=UPI003C73B7F9
MSEFVEINEKEGTIRKFKGVTTQKEAEEHVLGYNRIHVFSVKALEDIHGSVDQFMKQLGIEDFKRTGLFEKEGEES